MSDPTLPDPALPETPPESTPRRSRIAVWAAVAALAGLAITGIVISQVTTATAAQTPSASPTGPEKVPELPDAGVPPMLLGFGGPGPGKFGAPLHGEVTVETSADHYEVATFQLGAVTGTSADTLTVKSEDGYTATYRVDGNTRIVKDGTPAKLAEIAKDDTVNVVGVKSGSTVTARAIHDGCFAEKGLRRSELPRRWRHGPFGSSPRAGTPSPSSSSA